MRRARLMGVLTALLLGGCAGTLGQPTLDMDALLKLMEAHNGRGCVDLHGAYPPFGTGRIRAEWGEDPPACE